MVTDIEMPNMNGLELAQTIRNDPRFGEMPIIAVTSLAGEDDMQRGRADRNQRISHQTRPRATHGERRPVAQ